MSPFHRHGAGAWARSRHRQTLPRTGPRGVRPRPARDDAPAAHRGRLRPDVLHLHRGQQRGTRGRRLRRRKPDGRRGHHAWATQETNAQSQRGESPIVVTTSCANSSGTVLVCASAPGGSGTGNTITVGVSEQFTFLTPLINGLFNNDFQVGSAATAAVLNLAAGGSGGPAHLHDDAERQLQRRRVGHDGNRERFVVHPEHRTVRDLWLQLGHGRRCQSVSARGRHAVPQLRLRGGGQLHDRHCR